MKVLLENKKKVVFLILYILTINSTRAQEVLIGIKEKLTTIPIGDNPTDAFYYANDEGFYSLGSPIIDRKGQIVFLKSVSHNNIFIIIKEGGERESYPYKGNLSDFRLTGDRHFDSQQGMHIDTTPLIYADKIFYEYNYREKNIELEGGYYNFYPTPFGGIYYSERQKEGIAIVFDVQHPSEAFTVIPQDKLKSWLSTQPGGFSIGDDGLLYRNGILWSAMKPRGKENLDWRYLGRLISGHAIWCPGPPEVANKFTIVDAQGNIELIVEIPVQSRFNYGLGPWGELYYLFAPPMDKRLDRMNDYYKPEPGIPAELVVFRNYLKYFGRLNDGGVRLRKEPSTTAEILGTYPVKTGFRILETGTRSETISGQTNVWYHVRLLDGKEGWFFGAYVQNLYDGPNGKAPPWPNVPDW